MTDNDAVFVRDLRLVLRRDLETFAREIELMPDDESLWRAMPGVANSCGTLAMHCAGNLQHYVGAVLGGTAYVRDRPREFSRRTGARAEVAAELRRAADAVEQSLARLPSSRLDETFPEAVAGVTVRTRTLLVHLAVHLGFHLGQADYLRRTMTGDGRTADAVSIKALV